jgi:GAF domain-containing protein
MKVVHCTPEVSDLIGYSTKNPSLTLDSIQTLRRRRVVNVEDNREEFHGLINDQSLKHIRCVYGWKTAKSWLGCPIIHNQRCIAFIAVLTADSGTFLGKDHERIAEIVCDRTSWEFQKANRRYMLEKLNELAKDLTACSRDDLKIKMVELLQQWANRFVKPHSDIVVIARSTLENMPEKMLLKAASPGFDHRQLDLLSNLSKVWQHEERDWPVKAVFPNHGAERRKDTLNLAGIAVPVSLPKKARLQGHLCMLNRQPFHEDERQAARDAAREIAVILYTLQLDTEWRLASGRLRHMLLLKSDRFER